MAFQVQESSDCCINSKFSSAQKGYFEDHHLSLFVKKLHPRSPIINRGYYIRFQALEKVFHSWCSFGNSCPSQKYQIISLGAGYDTSFFRLKSTGKLSPNCHYIEIDFPKVMRRKYESIKDVVDLNENIFSHGIPEIVLNTKDYTMLGVDLTDINLIQKCFASIGIPYDIPSLFLSECSITYIDSIHSENVICWVQNHFLDSAFVCYEQVYPFDAFGIVMQNHFTQVGCPLKSITKYPNEESQYERFKKLGWSKCSVISMFDLFESFPSEEKFRIQRLELFDEYETWHEKCHHYILVWAAQGTFSKSLFKNPLADVTEQPCMKITLNWEYIAASTIVQRFGHQALFDSPSVILMSGGFGRIQKVHQRLGDIVLYHVESKKSAVAPLADQNLMGRRMFHSMTKLSNNAVVLIGGRSSPKEVFKEILVLQNCSELESCFLSKCFSPSLMPIPTWRHSASLIDIQETEYILVFGGRTQDCRVTNNCSILNTKSWQWSAVSIQKHSPCARHSHSAATYKKNCVIISGGLTENEVILQSVHVFNSETMEWNPMNVAGLYPRYSHTSHVWKDHLLLIGGITRVARHKLGVGVVNLKTFQAFEVALPAQDPEFPILLCNHSTCLQDDDIFIVGGGGNCFSFGTHFNTHIVRFNAKLLIP